MQDLPLFIPGNKYRRSGIHDQFGGNRQSGISASASHPFIFIFSSPSGHQHGYKDQWENPNVFSYTGEGQLGNMKFIRGNLELRNHIKSGKRVFLFIQAEKAYVIFEAELSLLEFDYECAHRAALSCFQNNLGLKAEMNFLRVCFFI